MSISGNITIIENEINAPITLAKDAYQLALATGFVGTLAEWLESLEGADGVAGAAGANGPAGPNSVTSATTSDGTANLSVATMTALSDIEGFGSISVSGSVIGGGSLSVQGATLYSSEYGSITAGPDFYGYPELAVGGSIRLSESTGTVYTYNLEASGTIFADNLDLQTPLPITSGGTGGTTDSAARTALKVPGSDDTGIPGAGPLSNIVSISQADYDAITVKDAATLYVIAP